jgi:O-antigen/teichoic acid export membrane protein
MDLTSKKPWKLMLRGTALVTLLMLLAILILIVGGKPLVSLIFGKAFIGAYEPLIILMAVPFLGIFSFPLSPMLYALGRSDAPLKAKLLGTIVFFIMIAPLSWRFGVDGAAVALVIGNLGTVGAMLWQLAKEYRRVRRPKTA